MPFEGEEPRADLKAEIGQPAHGEKAEDSEIQPQSIRIDKGAPAIKKPDRIADSDQENHSRRNFDNKVDEERDTGIANRFVNAGPLPDVSGMAPTLAVFQELGQFLFLDFLRIVHGSLSVMTNAWKLYSGFRRKEGGMHRDAHPPKPFSVIYSNNP